MTHPYGTSAAGTSGLPHQERKIDADTIPTDRTLRVSNRHSQNGPISTWIKDSRLAMQGDEDYLSNIDPTPEAGSLHQSSNVHDDSDLPSLAQDEAPDSSPKQGTHSEHCMDGVDYTGPLIERGPGLVVHQPINMEWSRIPSPEIGD